jgi:hypothetical protein
MSSGLRRAPQDPDYDPSGPYPDHLCIFTREASILTIMRPHVPKWPPNSVGRYRNTDPVLIS